MRPEARGRKRGAGSTALVVAAAAALAWSCGGRADRDAVRVGDLALTRIVAPEPVTGERTALYLRIENRGSAPDTLVGVDVGALGSASLHRTRRGERGMRMERTDGVPVPAGGTVELRPGGYHAMIEGPTLELAAGGILGVTLWFAQVGRVDVTARVVPYAALDSIFGSPGQE